MDWWNNLSSSKYYLWIIVLFMILASYCLTRMYLDPKNKIDTMLWSNYWTNTKHMMPDEVAFRNMIDLPGRDPLWMTESMVAPIGSELINDEKQKISKMEVLNMLYNDGINDNIDRGSRPKGLYVIP